MTAPSPADESTSALLASLPGADRTAAAAATDPDRIGAATERWREFTDRVWSQDTPTLSGGFPDVGEPGPLPTASGDGAPRSRWRRLTRPAAPPPQASARATEPSLRSLWKRLAWLETMVFNTALVRCVQAWETADVPEGTRRELVRALRHFAHDLLRHQDLVADLSDEGWVDACDGTLDELPVSVHDRARLAALVDVQCRIVADASAFEETTAAVIAAAATYTRATTMPGATTAGVLGDVAVDARARTEALGSLDGLD